MRSKRVMGVLAAAALVAAGGTTVVLAWPSDEATTAGAKFYDPPVAAEPPGDAEPVAEVDTADDTGTAVVAKAGKPRPAVLRPVELAARDDAAELPERSTEQFSAVSFTWTDPKAAPTGDIEVRTRSAETKQWSGWRVLDVEKSRPDSRREATKDVRGGTGAVWTGASDGVAARVRNENGAEPLPAGLRLNLIDPGTPAPAGAGKGSGGTGGAASLLPAYRTRAQWGANEALVKNPPEYTQSVKVTFVHHTAGDGPFNCADSPAILRAILLDQVQAQGWNDIGYNFLVDKCGTLFEGRKGGVDRPVLGAHTYGFNTNSTSIAVIGDYSSTSVPDVVKTQIARVAAGKLGTYGLSPVGVSKLTAAAGGKFPKDTVVDFERISGHRDGVATECPGNALYAQLASVRTQSASFDGTIVLNAPTGGVAYSGSYYVRTAVTMNWATTTPQEELTGFELMVDGVVKATVGPEERKGEVPVAAGTRKVQVRSVRTDGTYATTPATSVVADPAPPVFTANLYPVMRNGTVSTSVLPMTLTWKVTDNTKLGSVRLTTPSAVSFGATTTSWATSTKPNSSRTWTMRATDIPGNSSTSAVTRDAAFVAEGSAVKYRTWTSKPGSNYLNGRALYGSTKGGKLTWTFTGRAAGIVVDRTTTTGKIDIYFDGVKKTTIDTRTTGTAYRQLVWTVHARTAAKHTIAVVNQGTAGRPGVLIDDLVILK